MATLIETFESATAKEWPKEWRHPAWRQFLLTGEAKHLNSLPKLKGFGLVPLELIEALPAPDQMDVIGQRFLQACLQVGLDHVVKAWLEGSLPDEKSQRQHFGKVCSVLKESGYPMSELALHVMKRIRPLQLADGSPSSAGAFLLSIDDNLLNLLLSDLGSDARYADELTQLFVAHARERWKNRLETIHLRSDWQQLCTDIWLRSIEHAPKDFLEVAARAFEMSEDWNRRFKLGSALYKVDAEQFGPTMMKLASAQLLGKDTRSGGRLWHQAKESACWLIANSGQTMLKLLGDYFAAPLDKDPWARKVQTEYKNEALTLAAQVLQRDAIVLFEASFATPQTEVQLQALKSWSALKQPGDATAIAVKLRLALAAEDSSLVARAARLAGDLYPETVENELWSLLAHKSRPVREAAALTLAQLGESRLGKAKNLWSARRADTRIAAVTWLKALGTSTALDELKGRLDVEEDDSVRDAILLALETGVSTLAPVQPAELSDRIKKTLAKLKGPPVPWLDPKRLPPAKLKDGSKLTPDHLLYLLWRQSRVKDMRADLEAKPLYARLDRQTTGDLALAVLQAFFYSKADADDRWTMAFAALVGDDRLVPVIAKQIREWADSMRGKLAEYAVQALALLGTDAALLAVNAMAIRYRSKNKNIGKAATEAFADAARNRGLTVEELGDLVVPWLGFKPGEVRVLETAKARIEVRINPDFKLGFREAATQKKLAKLPDSAPAEIKAEFKELSAGLKEAVKSQLLRMETLMVRQFRWPAPRWTELYLRHPLLFPFAQRLVWGAYDTAGKLRGTFRALEDRSLTNAADEPSSLAKEELVGVVHPLELTAEARQAWLKHLADYDVVPPFAQLERPVVTVKPGQVNLIFGDEFAATEMNGMTFKGRAERLGWTRGSVCDAGCVNFYLKSFPAADVDVFIETEGMCVGLDMYTDITLGKMFFTKHGSVQIGSYVYDEPGDEKDPRLVPYGKVPAIAFSEALGDLQKIAAKTSHQAET